MSGVGVIHKRYDTTGIITSKTASRTTRKASSSSIRNIRATTTTKKNIIVIKPNSVIAKHISKLLQPVQDSDSIATIVTTACIEQDKLLILDNHNYDDKGVEEEKSQSSLLSLCSIFDNEINSLRQKKINRKCTGWKYDVKNNTIAMSNAIDVAVHKYIKHHKQERDVHCERKVVSTNSTETCITSKKKLRSTTPIQMIQPTETLLELSTTCSFDEICSESIIPQSRSPIQCGTKISHDSNDDTNNTNNNNNNIHDDDDDDDRIIPIVPTRRPSIGTNPTTTMITTMDKNHYYSVLENATTNIVSDDSEIDIDTTHTTTTKTTMKKNLLLLSLDGCNNNVIKNKSTIDNTIPNSILVSDTIKDEERMIQNFWSTFMELIQFHVTIQLYNQQSSNIQNKSSRCKKDIYELYKLSEPIPIINDTNNNNNNTDHLSIDEIRKQIYNEVVYNYHGITKDKLNSFVKSNNNNIRVHTILMNEEYTNDDGNRNIWIQINVGPSYDVKWNHSTQVWKNTIVDIKKNKSSMEFRILIQEQQQQQYVAVTCNNRMKSKTRYIPYVLSAIEHAFINIASMTASKNSIDDTLDRDDTMDDNTKYSIVQPIPSKSRISDNRMLRYEKFLSGIDPFELFRLAPGRHQGNDTTAVATKTQNPLNDLHTAATGCIYDNADCRKPSSKKRALDDINTSCNDSMILPAQTCLHWDWKGITNASTVCWDSKEASCTEASSSSKIDRNKSNKKKSKTEHVFTVNCRLTMNGTNVTTGISALIRNGYMKQSSFLPSNRTNISTPLPSSLLLGDINKK